MPTYEEQLTAYRNSLAAAAAPNATINNTGNQSPGIINTGSLAFNTMSSDLSSLANLFRFSPAIPQITNIIPQAQTIMMQPSYIRSFAGATGMINPGSAMRISEFRQMNAQSLAEQSGSALSTIAGISAGAAGLYASGHVVKSLMSAKILSQVASGLAIGGGAAGRLIGGLTGRAIAGEGLGALLAGGGAAAGTFIGSSLLPLAIATAGEGAVSSVIEQTGARKDINKYLKMSSWRMTGGKGFGKNERRALSRDIANMGMSDSMFNIEDMQTILQQGSEFGLFDTVNSATEFKKKFKELKENLKTITTTMQTSVKDALKTMAELKQGGFYTGTDQASAVLMSAGLGRSSGFSSAEMHAVGLQGAAMFRGTGIATSFGYEMATSNLANVKNMQRAGLLSNETINQAGGIAGAAQGLTASASRFMVGAEGRTIAALSILGGNDITNKVIAGESLSSLMKEGGYTTADIAKVNPENVTAFWNKTGAQKTQLIQLARIRKRASRIIETSPDIAKEDAFSQALTGMGITNESVRKTFIGLNKNPIKIYGTQVEGVREETNKAAYDRIRRQNTLYERTGIGGKLRSAGRWLGDYVVDPILAVGHAGSDLIYDAGLAWNMEEMSRRSGGVDKSLLRKAAMSRVTENKIISDNMSSENLSYAQELGFTRQINYKQYQNEQERGKLVGFSRRTGINIKEGGGASTEDIQKQYYTVSRSEQLKNKIKLESIAIQQARESGLKGISRKQLANFNMILQDTSKQGIGDSVKFTEAEIEEAKNDPAKMGALKARLSIGLNSVRDRMLIHGTPISMKQSAQLIMSKGLPKELVSSYSYTNIGRTKYSEKSLSAAEEKAASNFLKNINIKVTPSEKTMARLSSSYWPSENVKAIAAGVTTKEMVTAMHESKNISLMRSMISDKDTMNKEKFIKGWVGDKVVGASIYNALSTRTGVAAFKEVENIGLARLQFDIDTTSLDLTRSKDKDKANKFRVLRNLRHKNINEEDAIKELGKLGDRTLVTKFKSELKSLNINTAAGELNDNLRKEHVHEALKIIHNNATVKAANLDKEEKPRIVSSDPLVKAQIEELKYRDPVMAKNLQVLDNIMSSLNLLKEEIKSK